VSADGPWAVTHGYVSAEEFGKLKAEALAEVLTWEIGPGELDPDETPEFIAEMIAESRAWNAAGRPGAVSQEDFEKMLIAEGVLPPQGE
jgi:hypothetical protein